VDELKSIKIFYQGNNYDRAIKVELKKLGLRREQVISIIALPECMRPKRDQQKKMFRK
jgi:hypothetical protein